MHAIMNKEDAIEDALERIVDITALLERPSASLRSSARRTGYGLCRSGPWRRERPVAKSPPNSQRPYQLCTAGDMATAAQGA